MTLAIVLKIEYSVKGGRWRGPVGGSGDFGRREAANYSNNDNNKTRNKIITVIIVVYFESREAKRCGRWAEVR